jgi:hypothetical protein
MVLLPSISADMSYDSESSYKEQESEHRPAEKLALFAAAIFCAELSKAQGFRKDELS